MLLLCVQNSLPAIAQTTEQQYMERYWNYRDRYKKWFVKIGKDASESINLMEKINFKKVFVFSSSPIYLHQQKNTHETA